MIVTELDTAKKSIEVQAYSLFMIVDKTDVITGSFNFTKAAEESNAENCLILRGNRQLTNAYESYWQWRWDETGSYR
jgi:phosphatidylserine/phosphatidylglycerophosphate/cardiolipin synthase-like enzyme